MRLSFLLSLSVLLLYGCSASKPALDKQVIFEKFAGKTVSGFQQHSKQNIIRHYRRDGDLIGKQGSIALAYGQWHTQAGQLCETWAGKPKQCFDVQLAGDVAKLYDSHGQLLITYNSFRTGKLIKPKPATIAKASPRSYKPKPVTKARKPAKKVIRKKHKKIIIDRGKRFKLQREAYRVIFASTANKKLTMQGGHRGIWVPAGFMVSSLYINNREIKIQNYRIDLNGYLLTRHYGKVKIYVLQRKPSDAPQPVVWLTKQQRKLLFRKKR